MKKSLLIVGIYLFLAFILGFFLWWRYELGPVDKTKKEAVDLVINKGEGVSEVAGKLQEQGLIRDKFSFQIWLFLSGTAKKIKVGSFSLSPSMSTPEIVNILIQKGNNDQWVTIIEGLRAEQIGLLLVKEGFAIDLEEWQEEIKEKKLEGQLFPDSYLFPKQATQGAILKIIRKNFEKKVEVGLQKEITASGKSLDFVLTLASLIERETKTPKDRALVAGILLKRLDAGWPLQVDATVQYAVASQNCPVIKTTCEWWPKELTLADLQVKSPYNTYLYQGLPPGPICSPGLSSINAVLNPTNSPFWYYLSDQNGIMHYAATDEEHSANKEKYLY